jgi:hypothetical protein
MSLLSIYVYLCSALGGAAIGLMLATYFLDTFTTFSIFGMRFKLYKELP